MRLANVKIWKKPALMVGVSLLQLACLGGLALWCRRAIDNSAEQSEEHASRQAGTRQVMTDVARLFVGVGSMVILAKQDSQGQGAVLALRKEYPAQLSGVAEKLTLTVARFTL